MAEPEEIIAKYRAARAANAARDAVMASITEVRRGNMGKVFPSWFPEEFPAPVVANVIDTAARDLAEVIAPLPSFNCASATTVSDAARKFADKRTRIANNYIQASRMSTAMFSGADRYLTYGFLPFIIEPDLEENAPRIRLDNPIGAYPEFDRFGRLTCYMRVVITTVRQLCILYPEYSSLITGEDNDVNSLAQIELVSHHDKDATTLILPGRGRSDTNIVLNRYANPIGRPLVVVARRPGLSNDDIRGQFDDVMWIQLARHRFAMLTLEAAEKSVEAPLALPHDVQEIALGPDAILRSASPEKIRRVGIEVPQSAFAQGQLLDQEIRVGARYPEGRSGNVDASIITGKGVQALMGGFDTQVKAAQTVLADAFTDAVSLCFALDEKVWPNLTKTVRVDDAGTPYEVKYTPSKDIKGDHTCNVKYGLMAGLDPNRALIFGLQARGDKLISRDFLRRELPWSMDVTQEEQRVDIEQMRDALSQAMAGYAQAIPVYAQQGMDPSDAVLKFAELLKGRQKGKPIEDLVMQIFAPAPPPPDQANMVGAPAGASDVGAPMGPDGQQMPGEGGIQDIKTAPGINAATGTLRGVAAGQQGMAPGGSPALQSLMAGLDARGRPNMSASVQRRVPV